MASTIEFGKIIAISALYQGRKVFSVPLKALLSVIIVGIMVITSMGVYGFLSSSYQEGMVGLEQVNNKKEMLEEREEELRDRLELINNQIAEVPETYVTKRMELIDKFGPEKEKILSKITELENKQLDISSEKINKESEIGPVIVLSKSVPWLNEDKAMLYFILLVIFIFDPLAVTLTYAANVGFERAALGEKPEEKPVEREEPKDKDEFVSKDYLEETLDKFSDSLAEKLTPKDSSTSKRTEILNSARSPQK